MKRSLKSRRTTVLLLMMPVAFVLIFSASVVAGASNTLTFTSPAPGTEFTGTQAYTISGTITPIPGYEDNVAIAVHLQGQSQPIDEMTVSLVRNGSNDYFSYSTYAGGSSAWTPGVYVITATDAMGITGSTSFSYDMTFTTTTSSSSTT